MTKQDRSHLNSSKGGGGCGQSSNTISNDRVGEQRGQALVACGAKLLKEHNGQQEGLVIVQRVCIQQGTCQSRLIKSRHCVGRMSFNLANYSDWAHNA